MGVENLVPVVYEQDGTFRNPPSLLVVSDLDHTMVQNEDKDHANLLEFNKLWNCKYFKDSQRGSEAEQILVYSTGRSPALYEKLWMEAPLLTPDVLVCSVGTEVFFLDRRSRTFIRDQSWEEELDDGWDRGKAAEVAARVGGGGLLVPQVASEQRPHKLSYTLSRDSQATATAAEPAPQDGRSESSDGAEGDEAHDPPVVRKLRRALATAGVAAKVVFSGGEDVDVLARRAGKGRALEHVIQKLRESFASVSVPTAGDTTKGEKKPSVKELNILVCGDSGNDVELFRVRGTPSCDERISVGQTTPLPPPPPPVSSSSSEAAGGVNVYGCVVANAMEELRAFALAQGAEGPGVAVHRATGATGVSGVSGTGKEVETAAEGKIEEDSGAARIFVASRPCAAGIVEALRFYRLARRSPAAAVANDAAGTVDNDDKDNFETTASSSTSDTHASALSRNDETAPEFGVMKAVWIAMLSMLDPESLQGDGGDEEMPASRLGLWMDDVEFMRTAPDSTSKKSVNEEVPSSAEAEGPGEPPGKEAALEAGKEEEKEEKEEWEVRCKVYQLEQPSMTASVIGLEGEEEEGEKEEDSSISSPVRTGRRDVETITACSFKVFGRPAQSEETSTSAGSTGSIGSVSRAPMSYEAYLTGGSAIFFNAAAGELVPSPGSGEEERSAAEAAAGGAEKAGAGGYVDMLGAALQVGGQSAIALPSRRRRL